MTLEEYVALKKALREKSLEEHLRRQDQQLDAIRRRVDRNTWLADFSSNVAGNAAWDGLIWLLKILKK